LPGFNIGGVGGGDGDAGPSNVIEVRRKHRWRFEVLMRGDTPFPDNSRLSLQSASRPSFKFEEPEMHHNQEVARFAGKQDWDPVTLTWYDVQQDPDNSAEIYMWIESVVSMSTVHVAHPVSYKKVASLVMVDGFGEPSERWRMYGTWPAACNWGELDYTSTDLQTIEATMRFDRAVRDCHIPGVVHSNYPACG
jgi:hypothetical protein